MITQMILHAKDVIIEGPSLKAFMDTNNVSIIVVCSIITSFILGMVGGWFLGHQSGVKTILHFIQDKCDHNIESCYDPNQDGWATERKCTKCGKQFGV